MRRPDFWYTLDLKWKIMPGLDSHVSWNKVTSAGLSLLPYICLSFCRISIYQSHIIRVLEFIWWFVTGSPSPLYPTCMKLITVQYFIPRGSLSKNGKGIWNRLALILEEFHFVPRFATKSILPSNPTRRKIERKFRFSFSPNV